MTNSIQFTKATIVLTKGEDYISLEADLPTTYPEMGYPVVFKVQARSKYGEAWLKENFPDLPYDIIKA